MKRPAFLRRQAEPRHGWWCDGTDREQCAGTPCRHTYVAALTVDGQRVTPMVTESPTGPIVELWTDNGRILALDRKEIGDFADRLSMLGEIANGHWPRWDFFVAWPDES